MKNTLDPSLQGINTPFGDLKRGDRFHFPSHSLECIAMKIRISDEPLPIIPPSHPHDHNSKERPLNAVVIELISNPRDKNNGGALAGSFFHCTDRTKVTLLEDPAASPEKGASQ